MIPPDLFNFNIVIVIVIVVVIHIIPSHSELQLPRLVAILPILLIFSRLSFLARFLHEIASHPLLSPALVVLFVSISFR